MSEIIAKLHAEWESRCVSPDAPAIQRQEMKQAFYSGFIACLIHQLNSIATIEDDDEAEAHVAALHQEAHAYMLETNARLREPPRRPPQRFPR
jgi:hypothetical protein